jgi:hypothetical protein
VDLRPIRFRKQDDLNVNDLPLIAALFDRDGNLVSGKQETIHMRTHNETLERVRSRGISMKTDFNLKSGSYFLRVVPKESESTEFSALNRVVEIPLPANSLLTPRWEPYATWK